MAAKQDKEYIEKQFELYNADLVICCGTSSLLHQIIDFRIGGNDWKITSRRVWYHQYADKKFIIDFSHPLVRTKPQLVFYSLVDAIKEIRADK